MGGDPSTPPRSMEMNTAAIQMVEALWMLTYSSVYCYKNRYESDSCLHLWPYSSWGTPKKGNEKTI